MSTPFRSMPWNTRPDWDTLGRVLVTGLLIVATLLLSVRGGVEIARGNQVTLLYLLIGGLGFVILLARPQLALFLIPMGISLPPTMIPRLFGVLGILETLLPLTAAAWAVNSVIHRQQIRTNAVLNLALLAAVPLVASGITGRGDQDWARTYTWLGGCVTYLLALNLARDRRTAEKMLIWTALVTVGMLGLHFLTYEELPYLRNVPLQAYRYSIAVMGARGINLLAGMLAVVMPILVAYAVLTPDRRQRCIAVVGIVLSGLLGVLLLSRTFWVGMGIGLVAQMYVVWKRRGVRYVLGTLSLAGALVWLGSLLTSPLADLMRMRFEEPIGPRIELSVVQMGWAIRSPLWGYGSNWAISRYAHSVIPTALYDYGLIFTLPLLGLLGAWLHQAIRRLQQTDREENRASSLAHLGVVVGVGATIFFEDFLITNTSYLCLAFLIAGLLGATMSDEQESGRAV